MPKVSVIIPCYNQGAWLDEAVDSVLAQTRQDFEIVVVDDGSTDAATAAKLRAYARPKTRVLRIANRGLPGARNAGIREAQGEYILPLDADDRIGPEYLARAAAVLDAHPQIGIVYCHAELFGDESGPWPLPPFAMPDALVSPRIFAAALFRRADWEAVGGYAEELRQGFEDHDFWVSLLERGAGVHQLPETLFFYRRTAASMSRHYTDAQFRALLGAVVRRHRAFYERHLEDLCFLGFQAGEREKDSAAPPAAPAPPGEAPRGPWLPGATRVRALFPYVRRYDGGGWHVALDEGGVEGAQVRVRGWAFREEDPVIAAALRGRGGEHALAHAQPTPDVARAFRGHPGAAAAGFHGEADAGAGPGRVRLALRARSGAELALALPGPSRAATVRRIVSAVTRERVAKAATWLLQGKFGLVRDEARALLRPPDLGAEAAAAAAVVDAWDEAGAAPPPAPAEPCTLVVPVYNGLAFLPRLLESLERHTDPRHPLVLVEDASPDPGVQPLLEAFARRRPNATLLLHEANRGFVASVNEAARRAPGDFVVLNTDIELPAGWLERLLAPLRADPRVASATPFTDGGTINAFPEMNRDAGLPEGCAPEEVDRLFARIAAGRLRIEAPTGMGFCMAFRGEAVRKVGLLDEANFGRGYGEENDWCMRARAAGYVHALVPDLFVHHAHTGSFGAEKAALLERNLRTLYRRHPGYERLVADFIRADPAGPLRRFLLLRLLAERAAGRLRVVVDHDVGGGANAYRREWVAARVAAGDAVIEWLYRRRGGAHVLRLRDGAREVALALPDLDRVRRALGGLRFAEAWYNCAVTFPDPLGVAAQLAAWRAGGAAERLTVAIEDFFPLCPSFDLLDARGAFCGVPDRAACRACLPRNRFPEGAVPRDIDAWRAGWGAALAAADAVVCFSRDSRRWVERAYPDLPPERFRIEGHEVAAVELRPPRVDLSAPLHVGIVGGVNHAKGLGIVEAMARLARRRGLPVRFTVIGITAWPVARRIRVTGPYRREDLPELIERLGVNVAAFPSIWPETFSRVAEELMHMRLPLVCFDLGAPAERVRGYARGRVVPRVDAAAMLEAAMTLREELAGKGGG